jgi:tetratricopeptide (TPR) repeat protein
VRTILRLFLVAIVLGCAGLFLIASSSDKKDIERFEEYVEQGKSLLHRQDYSGALDMLTRAQSIDPYDNEVSRLIESTLKQIEQIDNEIYKGFRLLGESRADEAYEVFQSLKKRISPDDRQLSGMLQDGFDKVAELRREEYQKRIEESGSEYVNGEELKRIALLEEEVKKEEFNRKVNDIRREARGLFESEEYERSKREWEVLLGLVPDDEEASSFL